MSHNNCHTTTALQLHLLLKSQVIQKNVTILQLPPSLPHNMMSQWSSICTTKIRSGGSTCCAISFSLDDMNLFSDANRLSWIVSKVCPPPVVNRKNQWRINRQMMWSDNHSAACDLITTHSRMTTHSKLLACHESSILSAQTRVKHSLILLISTSILQCSLSPINT